MFKERHRPILGRGPKIHHHSNLPSRNTSIDLELSVNDLSIVGGIVDSGSATLRAEIRDTLEARAREVQEETGMSMDVLQIFAEDQRIAAGHYQSLARNLPQHPPLNEAELE